jgi:CubicO group peptidase (beta-lactamase class C family)
MRSLFSKLLIVAGLVSAFAPMAAGQSESAAVRRAKEIAGILSSGDRAAVRRYVQENFAEAMLKRPIEQHLGFFSRVHDQTRGLKLVKVQDEKPAEATYIVQSELTGLYEALWVSVEENAPHKVTGIGLRPPSDAPALKAPANEAEFASRLDAAVKKLAAADAFSGTVLIAKNGEAVYKAAFGEANKDFSVPNRIDTKFNLGSMNKMFTGVAIAQLVEKGKLSYDDPLSKFIPDFPNAEAAKKITIKHLLTHTSGLGGYFSPRFWDKSRANLRTVDDMMALVREDEKDVSFEPGSRWQYSNTGMLVLGKVIEVASGQSYFDYVRENIYKPAGMVNSDTYELDRINKNLAVGYHKRFTDEGVAWSNNIFSHVMRGGPQGGGYSTVEDLLRFDKALRSGKLVSAETFRLLTTPKPEVNSPRYGYGFFAVVDGGPTGHSGGFEGISSDLRMHLASGWTVIVMSNYGGSSGPVWRLAEDLISAMEKK